MHPQSRSSDAKKKENDSVAQLVEQYTFNVWVLGSNPSGITLKASQLRGFFHLNPTNSKEFYVLIESIDITQISIYINQNQYFRQRISQQNFVLSCWLIFR